MSDADPMPLPTSEQTKYLCEVGLGPIAFRIYGANFRHSHPALYSVLLSADLTARAIYGQMQNAAVELAGELKRIDITPTFLKGISASDEYYTPAYLRIMGDIDILVCRSECDAVLAKIKELGYEITLEQWQSYRSRGHHHFPAAVHPETGVTIEVHTGLFGSAELYSKERVFMSDTFGKEIVEFEYCGIPAARFSPEFQFIYTVSKWSVDQGWAINLKNINDTIHILAEHQSTFDWLLLKKWLTISPRLTPVISSLLQYLEAAQLVTISHRLRAVLSDAAPPSGRHTMKLLARLLHNYPFNAQCKFYSRYAQWRAHSQWLYLSRPNGRDLKIPVSIFQSLLRSANYGRYNPIYIVLFRLQGLAYRIRRGRAFEKDDPAEMQ